VTIGSVGGAFNSQVNLVCSQVPAQATCKLSPSYGTPGAKGTAVTVSIATGGTSTSAANRLQGIRTGYTALIELQTFGLFGMIVIGAKQGRKNWRSMIGLAVLVPVLLLTVGCAGGTGISQQGSGKTTAPGTYTILVTGTSGSLEHSVSLTLNVQ
jgi:hypothetical protein